MWILAIAGIVALWAAWTAYEVNKAGGYQPYKDNTSGCNQNCRQGRDCDCYERSCDMSVQEYDAQWPFPRSKP